MTIKTTKNNKSLGILKLLITFSNIKGQLDQKQEV